MIGANTKCATMKKYYTPDITEFHPEFEFEYKPRLRQGIIAEIKNDHKYIDCWNHMSLYKEYDSIFDIIEDSGSPYNITDVISYLKDDAIRVKKLDREDIESLGFKESSSFGYNTFKREIVSGDNSDEYKICYISDDEPTSVVVLKANKAWVLGTSKWNPIFRGTIKNKSELKKLLKQLGI